MKRLRIPFFFLLLAGVLALAAVPAAVVDAGPTQVAQQTATLSPAIPMRRSSDGGLIDALVWERDPGTGAILADDPIAAVGGCTYRFSFSDFPAGAWVRASWKIKEAHLGAGWQWFPPVPGALFQFWVDVPEAVGRHTLEVRLQVWDEDRKHKLSDEKRRHTVYALLTQPQAHPDSTHWQTERPKTTWLDVATTWAAGAGSEVEILERLATGVHDNPFGWGYYLLVGSPGDEGALLEGTADLGECGDFRRVWQLLAASLGVVTDNKFYWPCNDPPPPQDCGGWQRFVTSTRRALDRNDGANAVNAATGLRDRWVFTVHELGLYDGLFYDPTYGLVGPELEGNVFAKQTSAPSEDACHVMRITTAALWLRPFADKNEDSALSWFEYGTSDPQQLLGDVAAALVGLPPAGDAKSGKRLALAIGRLEEALAPERWEPDGLHLVGHGTKVFAALRAAVGALGRYEDPGGAKLVEDAIELIVLAGATVARTVLDEGHALGGDPGELAKAERELTKAQDELLREGADGHLQPRHDKALETYGKAWKRASKAR